MNYFKVFNFIKDNELRNVLILDYKEVLTCLKRQAYKASVILSGGITEAILKDLGVQKQNRSKVESMYRKIRGRKSRVEKMDLFYLIKTLESLDLISSVDASTANILRDFRNNIHPFSHKKRPNKGNAIQVKKLLDSLIKEFGKNTKEKKQSDRRGEYFFKSNKLKSKRESPGYKQIINILYKKKKVSFEEIRSLPFFRDKSNPSKSAVAHLVYLRSLKICSYDKKSWQPYPIKRYEMWDFNPDFNSLAKDYLKKN